MFSDTVLRSIDANRTIKDKIVESISRSRPRLRISVTDLTNPMQAYFRWVHPEIKTPIDKLQYMLLGTGFHDIFSDIVTTEEYVEQLLEYDGIVIDKKVQNKDLSASESELRLKMVLQNTRSKCS